MREAGKIAAARRKAEGRPEGRRVRGAGKIGRGAGAGGWAVPLPTIDPQIVLRSARSLERYGPEFTYSHFAQFKTCRMMVGTGIGRWRSPARSCRLTRELLLKLKDPGDGPTRPSASRRGSSSA